jgi:hypothetical protein
VLKEIDTKVLRARSPLRAWQLFLKSDPLVYFLSTVVQLGFCWGDWDSGSGGSASNTDGGGSNGLGSNGLTVPTSSETPTPQNDNVSWTMIIGIVTFYSALRWNSYVF